MFQPILRVASRQPSRLIRFPLPATRPLSSTRQLRLKEDKNQSPEQIEQAKQEQLKSGKKKEELESQSESVVGADREEVKDHDQHIEQLQKEAAKQHQREHPEGKS
ncbi:hypothetical protein M409DRAFT_49345 [Zasmidium cellare ATCC 36951]|uniref:Uncharacterized protein n=1 Tax=Zasmidium cellare ATCC 36951 TaxID=1080233 RepID=A0A6A6D3V4_ZASCE|nr:uncharacterized protein M409DRAFT_49345 [Zasmidium cellare ATCC 36951]KAF2172819.1 hypothetical protein M409DRAFT_49345 [Zasmidium cellare ATCC 36951]